MARFIVLVIDSYGVGYMDDVLEVRARDYGGSSPAPPARRGI